jgi:hypothetical protein
MINPIADYWQKMFARLLNFPVSPNESTARRVERAFEMLQFLQWAHDEDFCSHGNGD